MTVKGKYRKHSGLRDVVNDVVDVTILQFLVAEFDPSYSTHATRRAILAIIALPDGALKTAELSELLYASE